jgi:hypothetical protein
MPSIDCSVAVMNASNDVSLVDIPVAIFDVAVERDANLQKQFSHDTFASVRCRVPSAGVALTSAVPDRVAPA